MRVLLAGVSVPLFWLAGAAPAAAQTAPSFDCARATTVIEQAICHDPDLAKADATMGRLFAAARTSAFGEGTSNIMPSQVSALRERAKCGPFDRQSYGSREECLALWYQNRNEDLAAAALFAEPELALVTLRDADPELAPLYEAIFVYASHPDGTDWTKPAMAGERRRLVALLAPGFAKLQSDAMRSFGKDILHGSVDTLDDATASEENFSATLKTLAAYAEGKRTPMTMPCAALVRHPGLRDATISEFGSTLDVGIPASDCDTMLPPLPRLDALVARIWAGWPKCEGTIRFSAYNGFTVAVDDARRGSGDVPGKGGLPRVTGVQPATVDAVIAELAAYYARYRRGSPASARAAVSGLLDAAHQCGGGEE